MLDLLDNIFFMIAFFLILFTAETLGIKPMPNGDGSQYTSILPFRHAWCTWVSCVFLLKTLNCAHPSVIANNPVLGGMHTQLAEFLNILGTLLTDIIKWHYMMSVCGLMFMWFIFHPRWDYRCTHINFLRSHAPYLWFCCVFCDAIHGNVPLSAGQYGMLLLTATLLKCSDISVFAVWNPLSLVTEICVNRLNLRELQLSKLEGICVFITVGTVLYERSEEPTRAYMRGVEQLLSLFV
jgi:hypothetical protein